MYKDLEPSLNISSVHHEENTRTKCSVNEHTTQLMLLRCWLVIQMYVVCVCVFLFFYKFNTLIWKHLFDVVTLKYSGTVFLRVLFSTGTKCPVSIFQSNIQNVAYLEQLSQAE